MVKLTNIKFDGMHEMYEHVIGLSNLTAQLKNLRIFVNKFIFEQFILNYLSLQYGPFILTIIL